MITTWRNSFALIVVVGLCVFHVESMTAEAKDREPIDLIQSTNGVERAKGKALMIVDREKLIQTLISMVDSPVSPGEGFWDKYTKRNIAVHLLGEFRAPQATSVLIKWLIPQDGQKNGGSDENALPPAGEALVAIGLPAIPDLIVVMSLYGYSKQGRECTKVITTMLGPWFDEDWVARTIRLGQFDEEGKKNLQACLDVIKKQTSNPKEEDQGHIRTYNK